MAMAVGNNITDATGEHQTVIDKVKQYAAETHHGADHVERWNRVLAGFGDASKHTDPMTAQEAQVNTYRFNPDRWQPVADALASVQGVVIDKEAALITAATEWSQETGHGATHVERWQRVLAALDVAGYEDKAPMTIKEAQKFADKGWVRWTHVIDVLDTLDMDTTSTDTDTDTNRMGNGGGDGGGVSAHEQPLQIQTPSEIIIRPGFINNLKSYVGETHHGADHVKRWERVLYTFGVDGYTADSKMTIEEAQKYADRGWKRWNAVVVALTDLEQHGMLRDVSATLVTHDSITVEWWEPFIQRNYTIIISTLNETNQNQLVVISNQTVLTGASLGVSSHTVGGLAAETDYSILVIVNALQQTVIPSVSTLSAPVPQQNENILPGDTPQPLEETDVTPPTITAGAPITLESTGATTNTTLQVPTVSDDADGNPVIRTNITGTWQTVSSATLSHSFELGTHTVHWRATDASSNTADATQSVIIEDTTAPTIVVGIAITATSEGATTPVTLLVPLVSDTTDSNPVISTNITGTWQTVSPSTQVEHSFAIGTHTVHWRATDASSNTADATQSVTIIEVVFEQGDIGLNSEFGMPQQSAVTRPAVPVPTILSPTLQGTLLFQWTPVDGVDNYMVEYRKSAVGDLLAPATPISNSAWFDGSNSNALSFLKQHYNLGKSLAAIGDIDNNTATDFAMGFVAADDTSVTRDRVLILGMLPTPANIQKFTTHTAHALHASNIPGSNIESGDTFGAAVAGLGDANGDGYYDIAVGSPMANITGSNNEGEVHIISLNADRTARSSVVFNGTHTALASHMDTDDRFGTSLEAIGDVDGNGVTDLAVGMPHDNNGGSNSGSVMILLLNSELGIESAHLIGADQITSAGANDFMGSAIAGLGDITGDGRFEIAVGAEGADKGGNTSPDSNWDQGEIHILSLSRDGSLYAQKSLDGSTQTELSWLVKSSAMGKYLNSAGDLDGNGATDLLVGFPAHSSDTGRLALLFLNETRDIIDHKFLTRTNIPNSQVFPNDMFGTGVAGGAYVDMNGDGRPELAGTSPGADRGGDTTNSVNWDQGEIHVLSVGGTASDNSAILPAGHWQQQPMQANTGSIMINILTNIDTEVYYDVRLIAYKNETSGSTTKHVRSGASAILTKMAPTPDTTPPRFELIGGSTVSIAQGTTWTDPGYTCIDDRDGDISDEVVLFYRGKPLDTSVLGTYFITYDCDDGYGNEAPTLERTVKVVRSTPADTFTMSLTNDDGESISQVAVNEGGHINFRVYNDTKPSSPLIEFEVRKGIKKYNDSTVVWSGWVPVGDLVAQGLTARDDKGKALFDLYSRSTTGCCVKDGSWRHYDDTLNKHFAGYTIASHDDSYIGEAERHYEFRIADAPTQKFKAIVKEDDSYHGASYPGYVWMERANGGNGQDTTEITFKLNRAHFDGYSLSLIGDGPGVHQSSVYAPAGGWSTNIGPDREPYDIISAVPAIICSRDGEGFVNGYIDSNGYSFLIGRLQVCY